MGLDIYLIKIVKRPGSKLDWLSAEENPELKENFADFLSIRQIESEDGIVIEEKGYYYNEISYQRKGVKPSFYKKFQADDFVFTMDKLTEFEKCIEKDYYKVFKSEFIDRFIENENFIMISY